MNTRSMAASRLLRKSFGWSVVLTLLVIVVGILAIIIPPVGRMATIFVAWLLVFSGVSTTLALRTRNEFYQHAPSPSLPLKPSAPLRSSPPGGRRYLVSSWLTTNAKITHKLRCSQ